MSILQDHAGFNITSSKLQLVELNFEDDNLLLENVDEENFSDSLTSDVNNLENVDILRQSFLKHSFKKTSLQQACFFFSPR